MFVLSSFDKREYKVGVQEVMIKSRAVRDNNLDIDSKNYFE